ncbi:MAG: peptidase S1, partial [Eubacterium sp.]
MIQEKKKSGKSGLTIGLLGAVIGGAIVAAVILIALFATGTIGTKTRTETVAGQKVVVNDVNVTSEVEAVAQVVPESVVGIQTLVTENTLLGSSDAVGVGSGFIVTTD